jgi:hypothetical protein
MSAKLTKVGRLTARIEAAAGRLQRPLRLEDLTDEANAKLDRIVLEAGTSEHVGRHQPSRYDKWSDDQLIREMLAQGWLTHDDIKIRE